MIEVSGAALIFSAGGNTVRGLAVNSVPGFAAIALFSSDNQIYGDFLGTDASGTATRPNLEGLWIVGDRNVIGGTAPDGSERNLLSGNFEYGAVISGTNNLVLGNYVGTDVTGTQPLIPSGGRTNSGVYVDGGAGNVIGGLGTGAGNLISGNGTGICLCPFSNSVTDTTVQGNLIGTDISGEGVLSNAVGITLASSSGHTTTGNLIGGTAAGARNVVSGNHYGITLSGAGTHDNTIQGNYIGLSASGAPLGNTGTDGDPGGIGISIAQASGNQIGGAAPGAGNVISANVAHFGPSTFGAGIFVD